MSHVRNRTCLSFLLVVCASFATDLPPAQAYDWVYWNRTSGGEFLDPLNWTLNWPPTYPGGVNPETVDGCLRFRLAQAAPYTVTLSRDSSVPVVTVDNDHLILDLEGHRLTTNLDVRYSLDVGVWQYDDGQLTVSNGTLSAAGVGVATAWPNCTGTLCVGQGAKLELRDYAELALGGGDPGGSTSLTSHGNVIVQNGGQLVDVGTAYPMGVWVGGAPGTGHCGVGQLTVEGTGSRLYTRGNLYLGTRYGGQGLLHAANGGQVQVGWDILMDWPGQGALQVDSGATLSARYASVDAMPGFAGQATIDGSGSRWSLTQGLVIGSSGNGILAVRNGGNVVVSGGLTAAYYAAAAADVIVTGSASRLDVDSMTIAKGGTGTVTVSEGATITATSLVVGQDPGSVGILTLQNGGTFAAHGIQVGTATGGSGTVNLDGGVLDGRGGVITIGGCGTLNVKAGTLQNVGQLQDGSGLPCSLIKTTSATLILTGTNTYTGDTSVAAGTLLVSQAEALPTGGHVTIASGGHVVLATGLSHALSLGGLTMSTGAYGRGAFIDGTQPSTMAPPLLAVSSAASASPMPEPGAMALLAAGSLVGLAAWRQRKPRLRPFNTR